MGPDLAVRVLVSRPNLAYSRDLFGQGLKSGWQVRKPIYLSASERLDLYPLRGYKGFETVTRVEVTGRAERSLKKVPRFVLLNFEVWKGQIEKSGIESVQSLSGYYDEVLRGRLVGIRSARLSRGYRVYYRILKGAAQVVRVEEVNKHDYKKIERLFGY